MWLILVPAADVLIFGDSWVEGSPEEPSTAAALRSRSRNRGHHR
jgi:hypothetical protein